MKNRENIKVWLGIRRREKRGEKIKCDKVLGEEKREEEK